ncbi:MAG: hypothetical protein CM15mP58_13660 [Burkholderiaceae bacterium]|nr:MAG: hypothetical protein CM15mP58_13660 [Burkholderiaceae bacterium]
MKNLVSKNHNASCYINIVIKTVAHLEYPKEGSENFEKMFIDHGLLNLQPEPLDPKSILAEVQLLEKKAKKTQPKETTSIVNYWKFLIPTSLHRKR